MPEIYPGYGSDMQNICLGIPLDLSYVWYMLDICLKCAQDMLDTCMKYAKTSLRFSSDMPEICLRYAEIYWEMPKIHIT